MIQRNFIGCDTLAPLNTARARARPLPDGDASRGAWLLTAGGALDPAPPRRRTSLPRRGQQGPGTDQATATPPGQPYPGSWSISTPERGQAHRPITSEPPIPTAGAMLDSASSSQWRRRARGELARVQITDPSSRTQDSSPCARQRQIHHAPHRAPAGRRRALSRAASNAGSITSSTRRRGPAWRRARARVQCRRTLSASTSARCQGRERQCRPHHPGGLLSRARCPPPLVIAGPATSSSRHERANLVCPRPGRTGSSARPDGRQVSSRTTRSSPHLDPDGDKTFVHPTQVRTSAIRRIPDSTGQLIHVAHGGSEPRIASSRPSSCRRAATPPGSSSQGRHADVQITAGDGMTLRHRVRRVLHHQQANKMSRSGDRGTPRGHGHTVYIKIEIAVAG